MLTSARTSLRGLVTAFKRDRAVRDLWLALALGWALLVLEGVGPLWWGLVLATSILALGLEHLNTAIEVLLDRLHPQHDAAVGAAKDLASAAALAGDVSAAGAIVLALAFG